MQRFGGERIKGIMSLVGLGDDMPIENRIVTKSLTSAQVKVEGHHFESRKTPFRVRRCFSTNQRQIAYTERRKALGDAELKGTILSMVNQEIKSVMARHLPAKNIENWNPEGFFGRAKHRILSANGDEKP